MTAFSDMIDDLFASDLAEDAVYTPAETSEGASVRVISKSEDRLTSFGDSKALSNTVTFDVRSSEVVNPARGDLLAIGGKTYQVQAEPQASADRLVWTLNVFERK